LLIETMDGPYASIQRKPKTARQKQWEKFGATCNYIQRSSLTVGSLHPSCSGSELDELSNLRIAGAPKHSSRTALLPAKFARFAVLINAAYI
jgi:hypothetical protein